MNEINVKLTDKELVLLTAVLGAMTGESLFPMYQQLIKQVEDNGEYIEQYSGLIERLGTIPLHRFSEEVFGE